MAVILSFLNVCASVDMGLAHYTQRDPRWGPDRDGIRADPRGYTYGSICGHMAHGACGAHGMAYGTSTGRTNMC